MRRYLNTLHTGATQHNHPEEATVRDVRVWIMRRPTELDDRDRARLDTICTRSPALATTTELAQGFAHLARHHGGQDLITWVKTTDDSDIPELRSFASVLRKDWDAVIAGLTCPTAPELWKAT